MSKKETTTIGEMLKSLKEGESLVVVMPENGGYFIGIGDNKTSNTWAITQAELDKLAILCNRHKTKK